MSLNTPYQEFIHQSRYARWVDEKNRRETWEETVDRTLSYMVDAVDAFNNYLIDEDTQRDLRNAILNTNVMPSMRGVMTAGPALERDSVCLYNCSYLPVDSLRSFDEAMYILMCGTGVGYSVESKNVSQLPLINESFENSSTVIKVDDSKAGWAKGLRELLALLWQGQIPSWDLSKVRPAGARLKTFGGRASGPEPLDKLFKFAVSLIKGAAGRKLTPLEAHDLMCKIAEVVVVGGVRRSAMISLSDLDSNEMATAKSGAWWSGHPERALANNSAVYEQKPAVGTFMKEWLDLYESKSGERGIFNRGAARKIAAKNGRRDTSYNFGTNPSLVAGTRVWTTDGVFPIEQLQDKRFNVRNLNGEISQAKCWLSGIDKKVLRLNLEGGHYYDATPEHKWPVWNGKEFIKKTTPELLPGDLLKNIKPDLMFDGENGSYDDGFVIGWNIGDGWQTQRPGGLQIGFIVEDSDREHGIHQKLTNYFASIGSNSSLINKKEVNVNNPELRMIFKKFQVKHKSQGVPDAIWSSDVSEKFRAGFIDGLFSADGHVEKNCLRIRLTTAHEKLARDVADMLGFYGIKTSVRRRSGITNFGEFDSWSLSVVGYENISRFNKFFKLTNMNKQLRIEENLKNHQFFAKTDKTNFIKVISVEELDEAVDVWDISVADKTHAFQLSHCVTGNCSEIVLRPYGFCVAPDTPLITKNGIYNIGDLENTNVSVWNGEKWSTVTVRKTRTNSEVVRVSFSDGSYLDCTPDHKFSVKNRFSNKWEKIEAKDLMGDKYVMQVEPTLIKDDGSGINVDDAYTLGFAVGDGYCYNDSVYVELYGDKDQKCPVVGSRYKKYIPNGYTVSRQRVKTNLKTDTVKNIRSGGFRAIAGWNKKSAMEFFAGLADADGSCVTSGGIRIYISGEQNARDAQLVLTKFGIKSSVNLCQKAGTQTNLGIRKRDLWYLQISDARVLPTHRIDVSNGHANRFKGKYQTVRSVDKLENKTDVYCFNEPERHMGVFANVLTYQCNLTEVVVKEEDTLETLKEKVRLATILGTMQATFTRFKYLRKIWVKNAEEEALLGVSLTGQLGHKYLNGSKGLDVLEEWLTELKKVAIDTNKDYAQRFGINQAAAVTCVKPSGTVSQLVNCSSGMHAWHSEYYIRTVRGDNKDPLTQFLKDSGIPNEPDVMKPQDTTVFSFPVAAPEGALVRNSLTALEHLELWLIYQKAWCEHKPSITVSVKEEEWLEVGAWVYENFDDISGISFLPHSDHTYQQAPYQEINEEEYLKAKSQMPNINWSLLQAYEQEDTTTGSQELACTANQCEVVDVVTDRVVTIP